MYIYYCYGTAFITKVTLAVIISSSKRDVPDRALNLKTNKSQKGSYFFMLSLTIKILFSWLESISGPRPPNSSGFRITDTSHSVGFLWTSDQPVAGTST